MPKYIAFLRAINVGGRTVKMEELRKLFAALGLTSVETFIASGNVIFESSTGEPEALRKRIEDHLRDCLGYPVPTFLRTVEEISTVARYEPFPAPEMASAGAFSIGFLAEPLSEEAEGKLAELRTDIDRFHARGCEVYWLCAKKQSESRFSNVAFERKLGVTATFRGSRTIVRLAKKYPAAPCAPPLV